MQRLRKVIDPVRVAGDDLEPGVAHGQLRGVTHEHGDVVAGSERLFENVVTSGSGGSKDDDLHLGSFKRGDRTMLPFGARSKCKIATLRRSFAAMPALEARVVAQRSQGAR